MSTTDQTGLADLLESLSITAPVYEAIETATLSNPLDLCRIVLADLLSELVDCDIGKAYDSIQWPNDIANGDISVTVPKLCPGRKPTEVSSQLVDRVRVLVRH